MLSHHSTIQTIPTTSVRTLRLCTSSEDYSGHAWVIDGYLHKYYYNQENNQPTHLDHELIFLHCNYGWGGECDGYYQEGVFNLNIMRTAEERELYDIARRKMENYSTIVKIFEYWQ